LSGNSDKFGRKYKIVPRRVLLKVFYKFCRVLFENLVEGLKKAFESEEIATFSVFL
jgi:hypothetical protein